MERPDLPDGLRGHTLSWLSEHDQFLARVRASHQTTLQADTGFSEGPSFVATDDLALLGIETPAALVLPPGRVIWVARSDAKPKPNDLPAAAITLTEHEAATLRAAGIDSSSFLRWPTMSGGTPPLDRRLRISLALDWTQERDLPSVLEWLEGAGADGPFGKALVDVLPDAKIQTAGRRCAPLHPWATSEVISRADLVIGFGPSAAVDLLLAEAAMLRIPIVRLASSRRTHPELPLFGRDLGLPEIAPPEQMWLDFGLTAPPATLRVAALDDPCESGLIWQVEQVRHLLVRLQSRPTVVG